MKKIIHALWLMAVSFMIFSCTSEQEIDPVPTPAAGKAEMVLRLKTPSDYVSPASRSLNYADENTIDDVYVFVFDKNDELVGIKQGTNVSSSSGNSNPSYSGEGSFTVTLEASDGSDDTYKLVVLTNAKSIIENTTGFDVAKITKKQYPEVMAKIYGEIKGAMYSSSADNKSIPMWGESDQQTISKGSSKLTLQLTRALARIDVGVGKASKDDSFTYTWDGLDANGTSIPFKLEHVYVIRPNNSYAVVRDITKDTKQPTVPASAEAFEVDESISKFRFAATSSETGGYTSRDIYVPEAEINGEPGDENHTNRMAIVVGGYYNGNPIETFYRIDFIVNGSLTNVLRNHLYLFNISKVSGNGYPDAETAYNSRSMNMAVDINEWDETDMGNIVFDGQNTLSVSQDEYFFTYEERDKYSKDNKLYVRTDYIDPIDNSKSGWYVEKMVDVKTGSNVSWLSLSTKTGNPDEKTEVSLNMARNKTEEKRSAIIWLAAGRLRYPITVTQFPFLWARSNIVWDGSKLTFAVTPEENSSIPANSQGVFFKWGSLVAISPAAISGSDPSYTQGQYPQGHIIYSPTERSDYEWIDIPYVSELTPPFDNSEFSDDDFATYNSNTGFDAAAGKGDICRYITAQGWVSSGKWRLPTRTEFFDMRNVGSALAGNFDKCIVTPNSSGTSGASGYYQYPAGGWIGYGVSPSSGTTNPQIGVYFPAGGYRDSNGNAGNAGYYGYSWSGASGDEVGNSASSLSIRSNGIFYSFSTRKSGLPVRCVCYRE